MPSYDAADLGKLGYETYRNARESTAFDGSTLPDWAEVPSDIQEAWTASVATVAAAHEQTLTAAEALPAAQTVRAKFRCTGYTTTRWGAQADPTHAYEFQAMYDPDQPEDERFAKATPSGSLKFVVDNPAVNFEPGRAYYLDITPAEEI